MGRIRSGALAAAVLVAACVCLASRIHAQDEVIRVNVRLVRVLMTVKDSAGQLVASLNKNDFTVFDNNVRQNVAVFERRTEQPLSIAVLVDASASTGIKERYELDSVNHFLQAIVREGNPQDSVALFSFNWQVTQLSSFTRRIEHLESSLRGLKCEGGTSLYDAIYFAGRDLEERPGRHVIVVVTDGGDTTSAKDFHAALEAAQRADAVLYPVLVMPITNPAGRNIGGENALTTFAMGTGGRVFAPSAGYELDTAFSEILRELRTQYLLGYYPSNVPPTKERFHSLRVAITDPRLRVIARNGYYGDSDDYSGTSPGR